MICRRTINKKDYIHIIMLAYNREPIFVENIGLLKEAFKNTSEHYEFEITALCILPNHIHMIISPNDMKDCPKIVKAIQYYFTKEYDDGKEEVASYGYPHKKEKLVFQKRHYEHTLVGEDELNRHIDYIHYNPVKHELVANVKDWEYSSFNKFVKKGFYPEDWGTEEDIESISDLNFE